MLMFEIKTKQYLLMEQMHTLVFLKQATLFNLHS